MPGTPDLAELRAEMLRAAACHPAETREIIGQMLFAQAMLTEGTVKSVLTAFGHAHLELPAQLEIVCCLVTRLGWLLNEEWMDKAPVEREQITLEHLRQLGVPLEARAQQRIEKATAQVPLVEPGQVPRAAQLTIGD